jgi:hypothetical protein
VCSCENANSFVSWSLVASAVKSKLRVLGEIYLFWFISLELLELYFFSYGGLCSASTLQLLLIKKCLEDGISCLDD